MHYSTDFKLLIYPTGNFFTYFEEAKDPVAQDLWARDLRENIEQWPSNYEGLLKLTMENGWFDSVYRKVR